MKNLTFIILISLVTLSACSSNAQEKKEVQQKDSEVSYLVVSSEEFESKITKEESVQLIDVRTANEYNSGSIKNAENFDLLDGSFEKHIPNLDKTKTVYVFCAKGGRSGRASKLLEQNGFTSIIDLEGGYTAWSQSKK